MTRRGYLGALVWCAAAALAAPEPAAAAGGTQLSVESHCSSGDSTIAITEDSSLAQAYETSGDTGTISNNGNNVTVNAACASDGYLKIRVRPPASIHVSLTDETALSLGQLTGDVSILLAGGGEMHAAGFSGPLDLRITGASDTAIGEITGAATISDMGSGDVTVGHVVAPALQVRATGSGDITVGNGSVHALSAETFGSADLKFGLVAGDAELRSTGSGDITVREVTGHVSRTTFGSGDITVGGAAGAATAPPAMPAMPVVKMPAMPTMPAMPVMAPSSASASSSSKGSDVFHGIVTVVTVLGALALAVWFALRLTPLLRARAARRAAAARPDAGSAPIGDPRLASLMERLAGLSTRTNRIEHTITTREFELHRKFREMAEQPQVFGQQGAGQNPV